MWIGELFSSLREKCGRSIRGFADEEGGEITRRLRELLELENPIPRQPHTEAEDEKDLEQIVMAR